METDALREHLPLMSVLELRGTGLVWRLGAMFLVAWRRFVDKQAQIRRDMVGQHGRGSSAGT